MNENNALTVYDRFTDPLDAIEKLGDTFAKSGMFGCEKTEQGRVLALACLTERKAPFEILRTYHLIQGRLTMRSDAMLAAYRQRGGKVKWTRSDDKAAVALWTYQENENVEIGFTIEDAIRAKLVKKDSGWEKFPDAMLRARAISKALRMIAPEVVAGVYLPDERPIEVDTESGQTPAQSKPLLPTEPAPKTAPLTIDVEATISTETKTAPPAEAKDDLAALKSHPLAKSATEKPAATPSDPNKLDELFAKLQPHADKVTKFLVSKGWLTADQVAGKAFADVCAQVKPVHVTKILNATDRFLEAVNR